MTEPRKTASEDIDNVEEVTNNPPRASRFSSQPSTSGTASAGTSSSSALHTSSPECFWNPAAASLRYSQMNREEMREQLMDAIRHDRSIQKLLDTGIDVNFIRGNLTPLMLAALKSNARSVDLLLKKGADVHARSGQGSTALHFAINDRYGQCVQLLIDAGADVNCTNALGNTPLHYAAPFHEHSIHILLTAGASKIVRNRKGQMPYDLAFTADLRELLRP